jgi:hypothetical protein
LKQKRLEHESSRVSKKIVRALQDSASSWCHSRDLLEQTAQTTAGLMADAMI